MTFREWMLENLSDYLSDIAEHGCSAAFPHLTYYSDMCALYEQYKDEIWEALADDAFDLGYPSIIEMMANIFARESCESVQDLITFENLLVWYMAERTARELTEEG